MAEDKGLVRDPKKPNRWRDPETNKERLRVDPGHIDSETGKPYDDPRAAKPHVHGYDKAGNRIIDPSTSRYNLRFPDNPHFPLE